MKTLTLLCALLLSACATDRPAQDADDSSSGPTVYGRMSVSVDHTTIK